MFVLLALGLNVVVGFAGLLDLGYAAFFAIGAYTYAYGASGFTGLSIPFWPMLLVGALVAAVFGVLLGAPTLRLRGDYLAIVTLGFGEIVPVVFLNADKYTNGTNGITGIAQPSIYGLFGINGFGFTNPWPYYLTIVAIITVVVMLLYRLQDSRLGRAWVALREDELAAASMGINTITTKLLAFSIGASTAGLAGVFYAAKLSHRDARTSSGSPSRSPRWRWSSSAAWATSGASPPARSSSTSSRARASSSWAASCRASTCRWSGSGRSRSTWARSTS